MRSMRFTEEQIIRALRKGGAGASIKDLRHRHGISNRIHCRWHRKYGVLEVQVAKRLRALEDENRKPMHLLADQFMNRQALRVVLYAANSSAAAGSIGASPCGPVRNPEQPAADLLAGRFVAFGDALFVPATAR